MPGITFVICSGHLRESFLSCNIPQLQPARNDAEDAFTLADFSLHTCTVSTIFLPILYHFFKHLFKSTLPPNVAPATDI